jgi:hypothetical protein
MSFVTVSSTTEAPIPVHIGLRPSPPPAPPVIGMRNRFAEPPQDAPLRGVDYAAHGFEPRWVGMESGDCGAALDPNRFHSQGVDEFNRFLEGVRVREEVAVIVATMGNANDDRPRRLMATADASVSLGNGFDQSVAGARTPQGSRISLADGVDAADRDLGLRLRNRPADAPWWSMSLGGYEIQTGFGHIERHEPTGVLIPVLLDALGEPVVAVWVSDSGDQRWYLIPDQSDWGSILDWLKTRAFPEYLPGVLRRARSTVLRDPELRTDAETAAEAELAAVQEELDRRRTEIQGRLDQARASADPVRSALLYGTSKELEHAVASVLTDAGITVADLDDLLGSTSSADLLATLGARRRLVEVKSESGNASEKLMGQLENHLESWPPNGQDPVEGGVLIINQQYRLDPAERDRTVYARPEFVASARQPFVSTLDLFDWWRTGDWESIRQAIFPPASAPAPTSPASGPPFGGNRRWFGR